MSPDMMEQSRPDSITPFTIIGRGTPIPDSVATRKGQFNSVVGKMGKATGEVTPASKKARPANRLVVIIGHFCKGRQRTVVAERDKASPDIAGLGSPDPSPLYPL